MQKQFQVLDEKKLALQTLHADFVRLFDFASIGYLTLNAEGRIDNINTIGAKLLGMENKKIINQIFTGFIADQHKDAWDQCSQQQSGKQHCEILLNRKDDNIVYTRLVCLLKSEKNAPLELGVVIIDITELKQTENTSFDLCLRLKSQVVALNEELDKNKKETKELTDVLNFLVKQQEVEKLEDKLLLSKAAELTLLPIINKLKKHNEPNLLHRLLETLETNLLNLFKNHGCIADYSIINNELTRTESMVAAMVRQGLTTKAIARSLGSSPETINIHRKNIRKS